jgi:hypothetical protein
MTWKNVLQEYFLTIAMAKYLHLDTKHLTLLLQHGKDIIVVNKESNCKLRNIFINGRSWLYTTIRRTGKLGENKL